MKMPTDHEWYAKKAAEEADADPTTGKPKLAILNISQEEMAKLEKLANPSRDRIRAEAFEEAAALVESQWNDCWPSDIAAAIRALADPSPAPNVRGPDTATVARHMKDFGAFVAETAPKLHWKVYQDLGADPSRSNGYYDGWQHGFGEALFGPLPLPQLMDEMKASVTAKVAALAAEGTPKNPQQSHHTEKYDGID